MRTKVCLNPTDLGLTGLSNELDRSDMRNKDRHVVRTPQHPSFSIKTLTACQFVRGDEAIHCKESS